MQAGLVIQPPLQDVAGGNQVPGGTSRPGVIRESARMSISATPELIACRA